MCAEVSGSISWRRFCRIPLDGKMPHPATLMKLTTRCGETTVARLNETLLVKAAGAKLLRTGRVRAGTIVIPANVAYPADAGLLAKAVGKLVRAVRRVQAADGATGTVMTDRRRAVTRRAREMAAAMRGRAQLGREETSRVISWAAGDLAELRRRPRRRQPWCCATGSGRCSGRMRGRLRQALGELQVTIGRTATLVARARTRLAGQMPDGATRLAVLHDPGARPVRKGRIDKPVEFGYKAQVLDNDAGVVLDYSVERGAAPDGPQLMSAIERVRRRTGKVPRALTADGVFAHNLVKIGTLAS